MYNGAFLEHIKATEMRQISVGSIFTLMFGIAFLFYGIRVSIHICYVLLAVSLGIYLIINRKNLATLRTLESYADIRLLLVAFGIYAFASIPSILVNEGYTDTWGMQEAYVKFLLYGFILYAVFKGRIILQEKLFYYILFISGVIHFILAVYMRLVYGVGRVSLMNGVFQFGYFTSVIGIICLNVFLHYKDDRKIKNLAGIVYIICSLCLLLNNARGIELGYCIASIISFFIYGKAYGWIRSLGRGLLFVLVIVALFFSSERFYKPFFDRAQEARVDNERFKLGDYEGRSMALRYKMWDEAIAMFKLSPIVGMNAKTRKEMRESIQENTYFKLPIPPSSNGIGESHQQILNTLAKFGLIGLGALLFLYYAVLKVFIPKIKTKAIVYAASMTGIIAIYIIDGLFNTPLDSKVEAPLFCLCIAILLNLSAQKLKNPQGDPC